MRDFIKVQITPQKETLVIKPVKESPVIKVRVPGVQGPKGDTGDQGDPGLSAYELAVATGEFKGTLEQFLKQWVTIKDWNTKQDPINRITNSEINNMMGL